MRTLFLIGFLAQSTADVVQTPLQASWPDKHGSEFVFNTIELADNAETISQPSRTDYPEFYTDYSVRFVKDIPYPEGTKSVEFYALEAPSSSEGMLRWIPGMEDKSPLFQALKVGMKDANTVYGKEFPLMVHTGVGYLFKDKHGKELGRNSVSFWAISNGKADKYPEPKNRAVVAYTRSKGDWEGGYFSRAKLAKTLTLKEYDYAVSFMKGYAQQFPFYSSVNLVTKTGQPINPARTCNTFVEECCKHIANVDARKANLVRIGYLIAVIEDEEGERLSQTEVDEELKTPHPSRQILPSYWNEKGQLDSQRERPTKFFSIKTPSRVNEHNYMQVAGDTWKDILNGKETYSYVDDFKNKFMKKPSDGSLLEEGSKKKASLLSQNSKQMGLALLSEKLKQAIPNHDSTKPLTLQATCHSYSGARNVVGKGTSMSMLDHRDFTVLKDEKILRVQPGVRFIDVLEALKSADLSLPTHGNYGGQTIIGAVSTGTHGSGFPATHNFVKRMKVLNGLGEEKTLTEEDPEFAGYLSSLGSLGAILEMDMELVPAFNVKKTSKLMPHGDAIKAFKENTHMEVGFQLLPVGTEMMPAITFTTEVTKEPETKTSCCFNYFQNTGAQDEVLHFMNDFKYDPAQEPAVPRATHCQHSTLQVYELSVKGVSVPAMSVDINIAPEDFDKTLAIITKRKWAANTDVLMRWILKDEKDVLLSPYYDGNRISLDISQHLQLRAENDRVEFGETRSFQDHVGDLYKEIEKAGIKVRYHVGKNGFQDLKFWDEGRFNRFMEIKQENDPKGVFSNYWFESQKKKAGAANLIEEEKFVLSNTAYGTCYEAKNAGAKSYLWDCIRNGFSGNRNSKDENWDLHSAKDGGRTCKDMGFMNFMGVGPPYKRMPVEVSGNAQGTMLLAPIFAGHMAKQLDVLGKFQLDSKCTEGPRMQYP